MKLLSAIKITSLSIPVVIQMAVADVSPYNIRVVSPSDCSRVTVELVGQGQGIQAENFEVTASSFSFDFKGAVSPSSAQISGSMTRTIQFPVTSPSGTILGVHYRMGTSDLEAPSTAEYFAVYSCSSGTQLFECVGRSGNCPRTIIDYYPQAQISEGSGDFGDYGDFDFHYSYVGITNTGRRDLSILGISIEGPDAGSFTYDYYDYGPIPYQNSTGITLIHQGGPLGTKTATLKIITNDFDQPVLTIPLSINILDIPDLSPVFGDIKAVRKFGRDVIEGTVTINNRGTKKAKGGAYVIVTEQGDESKGDKSPPRVIFKRRLSSLKPGKLKTFTFTSGGHNLEKDGLNKIYNVKVVGSRTQKGTNRVDDNISSYVNL